MAEATATVESIETKPTSNGGTLWLVKTGEREYKTFKPEIGSPASTLVGKQANITFTTKNREKDGRTFTDHFLDAISEHVNGSGLPDPYVAKTSDGAPDWDKKGLHMTRCALWNHFLSGHLAANLYAKAVAGAKDDQKIDPMDYVIRTGTRLVVHAEKDVFERAAGDDGIPFELNQDIEI